MLKITIILVICSNIAFGEYNEGRNVGNQEPRGNGNYLTVISSKSGDRQGPQVFIPRQKARISPFRAPDQYNFVPPEQQPFRLEAQAHQHPPVLFDQPEFAVIEPVVPIRSEQPHYQRVLLKQQQGQYVEDEQIYLQPIHQGRIISNRNNNYNDNNNENGNNNDGDDHSTEDGDNNQLPPITRNINSIPRSSRRRNNQNANQESKRQTQDQLNRNNYFDYTDLEANDFGVNKFDNFGRSSRYDSNIVENSPRPSKRSPIFHQRGFVAIPVPVPIPGIRRLR